MDPKVSSREIRKRPRRSPNWSNWDFLLIPLVRSTFPLPQCGLWFLGRTSNARKNFFLGRWDILQLLLLAPQYAHHVVMEAFFKMQITLETKIWESGIPEEVIHHVLLIITLWDSTLLNLCFSSPFEVKKGSIATWWAYWLQVKVGWALQPLMSPPPPPPLQTFEVGANLASSQKICSFLAAKVWCRLQIL